MGERDQIDLVTSSQNIRLKWFINLKRRQCTFSLLRHFKSAIVDLEQEDIIYSISFGYNSSYKIFGSSQTS